MIEAGRAFIVGRQRREWGSDMRYSFTRFAAMAMAAVGLALSPLPLSAQMTEIDPHTAIDSDLDNPQPVPPPPVKIGRASRRTRVRPNEYISVVAEALNNKTLDQV